MRWGADDDALRQRLGIQLQDTQFSDKLTVEEVVALFRSFYRRGPSVDEVLAMVELESKRRSWVGKLSGGQKQRLAVACALVNEPDLLFLDEPTTGLDPQSRRQLWALLERFRARGGTIVLTTHYMDEAETLCDRIAIVDQGRVIALGTPRELIASLGRRARDRVRGGAGRAGAGRPDRRDRRRAGRAPGRRARVRPRQPVAHGDAGAAGRAAAAPASSLSHFSTHQATLEDVFVALTGRHLRDD